MPITSMRVSRSAGEDVDVVLAGTIWRDEVIDVVVFDPQECSPCSTARIMATVYSFQSEVVGLLYWEKADERDLVLPLEGRGTLDFRQFNGLMNPKNEGWTGRIVLRVEGKPGADLRHFALCLDLSKQRN